LDVSILPLPLLNISLVVNFAALTLYFA